MVGCTGREYAFQVFKMHKFLQKCLRYPYFILRCISVMPKFQVQHLYDKTPGIINELFVSFFTKFTLPYTDPSFALNLNLRNCGIFVKYIFHENLLINCYWEFVSSISDLTQLMIISLAILFASTSVLEYWFYLVFLLSWIITKFMIIMLRIYHTISNRGNSTPQEWLNDGKQSL